MVRAAIRTRDAAFQQGQPHMSDAPATGANSGPLDPRLVVLSRTPLNAETPLAEQVGVITPNELFYFRNRFNGVVISPDEWRLTINGEVERPYELTYEQLRALPSRTVLVTLECAGNGRTNFDPTPEGEPWEYGAVSTAEWTGVSLGTVLAAAGLTTKAREIVVESADKGRVDSTDRVVPFARGMNLETALHPDTLLAYSMNGVTLPVNHGFPLRLVVSGWYGMAAAKWVTNIRAVSEPFVGFFQSERYIMERPDKPNGPHDPVTIIGVRSLFASVVDGATLARGEHRLRGLAWSGHAAVERVEVSVDGGATWQPAELTSAPERYAWRRWEFLWQATSPGPVRLQSRAFDAAGNSQPAQADWNRLGYANNAIQSVAVKVE
jgi:DMSO/TMAO reductase YedYZ molybdopterin-dependent catalytic subunit